MESLEQRVVLAGAGLNDPPGPPAWESVIVALNDNIGDPAAVAKGVVNTHGGQLGHVYEHAIKGFSAQLPAAAVQALLKNPQVKLIEPDLTMQAFGQVVPTGINRIDADLNSTAKIDGIDERVNVDIAIIDTGIDGDHPDLNVVGGQRFYTVTSGPPRNRGSFANDGHGSHVAGTAAALDNDIGVVGVAPGARLWAVKVLDANGSGYLSDIIKGIDWVTAKAGEIEVVNMSLGGQGVSDNLRAAITASVNAGIVYVVAAGNEYRDILGTDFQFGTADDTIPAAYPEVATISAIADTDGTYGGYGPNTVYADYFGTYDDDEFADFSNFSNSDSNNTSWYDANNNNNPVTSPGLGIDLMLPGVDIYSTYKNGGYATSTGTSMASPHAAGLAALYIAEHVRATNAAGVYAIRQALINNGKAWRSPEGLLFPATGGNSDSPDKHEENLGWAANAAPDNTPPFAPSGLSAVAGNAQVVLDWADNTESDLAGYNVYRSTTSGGLYTGANTELVNSSSFTNTGVAAGTYYYIVTALDWSGNESAASNETSATVVEMPPAAPSGLSAVPGSGQVVLDWADNTESDLAGYNVYRRVTGGLYDAAIPVSSSSFTDTDVTNGTTYYYVVTAVDFENNASDNSSEVEATPDTLHIGDLDASSTNQGGSWTATVTIVVHSSAAEAPVVGASVAGNWNGGALGTASCTTDSQGTCIVVKPNISKKIGVVRFEVTGVSGALAYLPSANHDVDLGSNGTFINVNKPLHVANASVNDVLAGSPLTQSMVRPLVEVAISHWAAAGVAADRLDALRKVDVEIADLDGTLLGLAYTDWIVLDRDAAGYGWSADPFAASSRRTGGVALLSAVTHEFGHLLGFDDDDSRIDVMAANLDLSHHGLPWSSQLSAPRGLILDPLASTDLRDFNSRKKESRVMANVRIV
ncbi:MAG: S8 family serine peptidase, partial [Planctomycetia bacterium]|nr:S8 family serine peptidase [Planctomycetia bacterium]